MDSAALTPILPLTLLECRFELDEPPRLPAFPGSAWRGVFGHALKRAVCVVRHTDCGACLLYRSCVYPYIFETPPPPDAGKMRRYSAVPHPFALRVEPRQSGLEYHLGVTLFGRAERHLPYVVHALSEAGRLGLGRDHQPFRLIDVQQARETGGDEWLGIYAPGQPLQGYPATSPTIVPCPDRVQIRLLSPLRLRTRDRLATPATFRFSDLFGHLLRRISLLTYFHTDTPLEIDFAALTRAAAEVPILEPRLRWYDWTRYSSRQETTMDMGGLVGSFDLPGEFLAPFWPYLWLGQFAQVGKGTTMGLGRYEILQKSAADEVDP
jgi:hypothetical protein